VVTVVDMQDAEVRRLTRQVAADGAREPFGAYLFHHDEAGADLCRYLEQKVFFEACGDPKEVMAEAYAPYDPSSLFFCVVDHLRMVPAGMMRVVVPSALGFKSLSDIEPIWGESAETLMTRTGIAIDLTTTWDIATLAADADYRGKAARGLVLMGLYQSLALSALPSGVQWFVTIIDMPVFRLIRWQLCLIFAGYKGVGPRPYMGSPTSIPAWCDVVAAEKRLASTNRDLYEILVQGIGLEPALRRVDLDEPDRLAVRGDRQVAG